MAFVFGTSPESLMAGRQFYDAQNIRMAEADRAARQQAIEQQNQNFIFAQRQAQENARQQAELDAQAQQRAVENQFRSDQSAEHRFEFALGQKQYGEQKATEKERYNTELGFKQRAEDFSNKQADALVVRQQFNDLIGLMKSGRIVPGADLGKLFDKLSPEQISLANKYGSMEAEDQDKELQNVAAEATNLVKSQLPAKKTPSGLFGWGSGTPVPGQHEPIDESLAKEHLSRDKELRSYSPMLRWDQELQQFVPAKAGAPKLAASPMQVSQLQPATSNAPTFNFNTPAPLSGGVTNLAQSPAISATVLAQQAYNPRQDITAMMSLPKPKQLYTRPATPGYIPGRIYRGRLYVGGDPNDRNSWQGQTP